MRELIQDNVKVELEYIGEGWNGDYDPDDQEDTRLLRFSVLELRHSWEGEQGQVDLDEPEWFEVDDASYCTALPEDTPTEEQDDILRLIMGEVYIRVRDGLSIKKIGERLSWLPQY